MRYGRVAALLPLFILLWFVEDGNASESSVTLQELHRQLTLERDDQARCRILNQLARAYCRKSIDKAYEYNKQAFTVSRSAANQKAQADSYVTLAQIQQSQSLPIYKVLLSYQLALKLYPADATQELIEVNQHIGELYIRNGSIIRAVKYFKRALDLSEFNPDAFLSSKINSLIYLSRAAHLLHEYDRSFEYNQQARDLLEQYPALHSEVVDFKLSLLSGDYFLARNDTALSRTYFTSALQKDLELIPPASLAQLYLSMGSLDLKEEKFERAEHHYLESLAMGENSGDIALQLKALKHLANQSLIVGDSEKCLHYSNLGIHLSQAYEVKADLSDLYAILYQLHEKNGHYQEALEFHKRLKTITDQLNVEKHTIEHIIGVSESRLKEKQAEIDLLYQDKRIHKSRIFLLTLLTVIGGCVAVGVVYFMLRYRWLNQTLKVKYKEVEIARNEAVMASKIKQDFLSVMSHEIRTPMNAVMGLTNILRDESPREDQIKYLNNLHFSAKNLLFVINNILDFSKIESGKLSLVQEEFTVQDLLNNIINSVRYSKKKEDLIIRQNQLLEPLKNKVKGDAVRLNQILVNLIGNAIKFTPEGSVVLHSRILARTGRQVKIQFDVEDTGIGIPRNKLASIFESFSQVTQTHDRQYEGSGLGLAITKKLVELHAGQISVKSEVNKGSIFTVILEFELGESIAQQDTAEECHKIFRSGIEGQRVLLVEDNKINQLVAKKILTKLKAVTTIAENGVVCLDHLAKNNFDVILMDIHMPVMDGIEATKRIRSLDNDKRGIPIVGLSADAYSEAIEKAMQAGMDHFLSKPFKPEDLFEVIKKAVSGSTEDTDTNSGGIGSR